MNGTVIIKNSRINRQGTYASTDIKKGEIVLNTAGTLIPDKQLDEGSAIAFNEICFQVKQGYHICPTSFSRNTMNGIFLVNSSCDPNCGIRGSTQLVAMRDIKKGEEITFDYAMVDADYENMEAERKKCLCKSANCRGFITGKDWQNKDLQKKYKGYFSDYVQSRIDKQEKGR